MSVHNIQESNALLLYRVGPVYVCSPTMPVEAVSMPPKLTVPPGASVAEPGVFKSIHGMVRLVDLRVRFGVDKEDMSDPGKIVIVEVEGGHAGFWVDEIEDVISFPTKGWSDVPAYIPRNVFTRTLIEEHNIRLYADFEQLDKFKSTGYLRKHIEMIKVAAKKQQEREFTEVSRTHENAPAIGKPPVYKETTENKKYKDDVEIVNDKKVPGVSRTLPENEHKVIAQEASNIDLVKVERDNFKRDQVDSRAIEIDKSKTESPKVDKPNKIDSIHKKQSQLSGIKSSVNSITNRPVSNSTNRPVTSNQKSKVETAIHQAKPELRGKTNLDTKRSD